MSLACDTAARGILSYNHSRVMIFEEHLEAFAEGVQKALQFLGVTIRPLGDAGLRFAAAKRDKARQSDAQRQKRAGFGNTSKVPSPLYAVVHRDAGCSVPGDQKELRAPPHVVGVITALPPPVVEEQGRIIRAVPSVLLLRVIKGQIVVRGTRVQVRGRLIASRVRTVVEIQ